MSVVYQCFWNTVYRYLYQQQLHVHCTEQHKYTDYSVELTYGNT